MKIKSIQRFLGKILYGLAKNMPPSDRRLNLGSRIVREFCAHLILNDVGKHINIEPGVYFADDLTIGDYSGLGQNSSIGRQVSIGKYVMMGQECHIFTANHKFDKCDMPMCRQGWSETKPVVIADDVWIGARVTILPGVHVGTGSIIGACSVVTHDVPPFAVVAGNPAKIIKKRKS